MITTRLCAILLVAVGLLNLYPLVGVVSADKVNDLYGVVVDSPDLETLMRHRAVMLGLIGALLLLAAFRPPLQMLAATIGLASMLSFVIIALMVGGTGELVGRVVMADTIGSVAALAVILLIARGKGLGNRVDT